MKFHNKYLKSFDSERAPSNLSFAKNQLETQKRLSAIDESMYTIQAKAVEPKKGFIKMSDFK